MIGKTIKDRYRITEEIGRGGTGIVFKAIQLMDGGIEREVAIKSLLAPGDLQNEARVLVQLVHPNLVCLFDVLIDEGRYLLVMEYIEGSTLQKWIDRDFTDLDVIVNAWQQILQGIDAIHTKGISHLDIKPANIFVTESGQVKIGDFGLAATGHQGTRPIGTAKYMAPEMYSAVSSTGKHGSRPKRDIYSAGFTIYELFLGKTLFNEQFAEICSDPEIEDRRWANWHADASIELPPLHRLRSDISPELSGIVERMCAKDPSQRYSDVKSIMSDLKHVLPKHRIGGGVIPSGDGFNKVASDESKMKKKHALPNVKPGPRRLYLAAGISILLCAAIIWLAFTPPKKDIALVFRTGVAGAMVSIDDREMGRTNGQGELVAREPGVGLLGVQVTAPNGNTVKDNILFSGKETKIVTLTVVSPVPGAVDPQILPMADSAAIGASPSLKQNAAASTPSIKKTTNTRQSAREPAVFYNREVKIIDVDFLLVSGNSLRPIAPTELKPEQSFRIRVKSNVGGFLYIIQDDPRSQVPVTVFPQPGIARPKNPLDAEKTYVVPDAPDAFRMETGGGPTSIHFIISKIPLVGRPVIGAIQEWLDAARPNVLVTRNLYLERR